MTLAGADETVLPTNAVLSCPLCGSQQGETVRNISYKQIFAALLDDWGVTLSDGTQRRHVARADLDLVACSTCGLQYFSPAIAGDGAFYAEVMAVVPYE